MLNCMGLISQFKRKRLERNLAREPHYFADMGHAQGGGQYLVEAERHTEYGADSYLDVIHSYFRRKKGDEEINRTRITKGIVDKVDKTITDKLEMKKIMLSAPLLYALLSGMSEQEIEKALNFKNSDYGKRFFLDSDEHIYNGEFRDNLFADKLVQYLNSFN